MITLKQIIIICPLVGLAGFVDSIAGGGGLISLPAFLIAGVPPITASATNKLSAFMGATVSFTNYIKKGFVNIIAAIPCVICALIFSSFGAKVQVGIPENYLRIFMLIALPITLLFILRKKSLSDNNNQDFKYDKIAMIKAIFISCVLGFYDGLYGPGTGTFLLLFFVNVVKMKLKDANGMSKAINWSTNAGALMYFFYSGKVIVPLAIMAGICNMTGAYLGSNLFAKKGVNIARPIMITVMIIFIIKVVIELCMQ